MLHMIKDIGHEFLARLGRYDNARRHMMKLQKVTCAAALLYVGKEGQHVQTLSACLTL